MPRGRDGLRRTPKQVARARGKTGVLLASGAAVAAALSRFTRIRSYKSRTRGGYNCCEFCGARLLRDAEHTWRYSGTCAKCGREQPWASVSA